MKSLCLVRLLAAPWTAAYQVQARVLEWVAIAFSGCIYIYYLEFFCLRGLSILPYIFIYWIIYLYQNGVMDIYFVL